MDAFDYVEMKHEYYKRKRAKRTFQKLTRRRTAVKKLITYRNCNHIEPTPPWSDQELSMLHGKERIDAINDNKYWKLNIKRSVGQYATCGPQPCPICTREKKIFKLIAPKFKVKKVTNSSISIKEGLEEYINM